MQSPAVFSFMLVLSFVQSFVNQGMVSIQQQAYYATLRILLVLILIMSSLGEDIVAPAVFHGFVNVEEGFFDIIAALVDDDSMVPPGDTNEQ